MVAFLGFVQVGLAAIAGWSGAVSFDVTRLTVLNAPDRHTDY
jgi:hypothetical protein